jgi:hypothetical protein
VRKPTIMQVMTATSVDPSGAAGFFAEAKLSSLQNPATRMTDPGTR